MTSQFDFDEWARLARQDPAAFETRRARLLEQAITTAPERLRPRLRAVQWRIDQERRRAGSPLGACLRLQQMLHLHLEARFIPALEGRLGESTVRKLPLPSNIL